MYNNNPKLSNLANYLLCCTNPKLPMYNNHYITGKNIAFFTKLVCVENTLSDLTSSCKNLYNNCYKCYRKF